MDHSPLEEVGEELERLLKKLDDPKDKKRVERAVTAALYRDDPTNMDNAKVFGFALTLFVGGGVIGGLGVHHSGQEDLRRFPEDVLQGNVIPEIKVETLADILAKNPEARERWLQLREKMAEVESAATAKIDRAKELGREWHKRVKAEFAPQKPGKGK